VRAVCPRCQSVGDAGAPAPAPHTACRECGEAQIAAPRADPTGLVKRDELLPDGTLVLRLTRPREPAVRVLVVAMAWNALVASALVIAWENDGGTIFVVLALLLSAGLGATYLAVRGLVNHVHVEVGPRGLCVEERPLPPWTTASQRSHPRPALLGFALDANADAWAGERVHVLLRDGRAVPLPYAFARREHAAWVAEALQRRIDETSAEPLPLKEPSRAPLAVKAPRPHPRLASAPRRRSTRARSARWRARRRCARAL